MYSPKIKEDLIAPLYHKARADKKPMTKIVDQMLRAQLNGELTTEDLQFLLAGHKIRLDCGHLCTVGHNFANTMIILSEGGGRIKTVCHECGY